MTIYEPYTSQGGIQNPAGSRVQFGWAEWIGLALLAATPASGFAWWGHQMTERVATLQTHQTDIDRRLERLTATLEQLADRAGNVIRMDESLRMLDRRVERIERHEPARK